MVISCMLLAKKTETIHLYQFEHLKSNGTTFVFLHRELYIIFQCLTFETIIFACYMLNIILVF